METATKKPMTAEDVFFEILLEKFTAHIEAQNESEEQAIKAEILEFIKNPNP